MVVLTTGAVEGGREVGFSRRVVGESGVVWATVVITSAEVEVASAGENVVCESESEAGGRGELIATEVVSRSSGVSVAGK